MNCCKIITSTLIIASSLFANQYQQQRKVSKNSFCLYPELKQPIEILKKTKSLLAKAYRKSIIFKSAR